MCSSLWPGQVSRTLAVMCGFAYQSERENCKTIVNCYCELWVCELGYQLTWMEIDCVFINLGFIILIFVYTQHWCFF